MTIRFLTPWGKYAWNNTDTLDSATEAALVAAKVATTDLTGGVPYSVPAPVYRDLTAAEVAATKGMVSVAGNRSAFTPYKVASYGDSRANIGGTSEVFTTNAAWAAEKVAVQLSLRRGDMRLVFNGGVSGDTTANWNSASRISASQGITACLATQPDIVLIQYGINDNIAGTAAATTFANLQALVAEFLGAGVYVVFESINPAAPGPATYINGASSAGGYSSTTTPAEYNARLALTQSVNASMQAWLATFPGRAVYVDTSSASTGADGFAKTDQSYYDGTHMSIKGCFAAAALVDTAISAFYPRRAGKPLLGTGRNAVNDALLTVSSGRASGYVAVQNEAGTTTATYQVTTDADGEAVQEYVVTPTVLASGVYRARLDITPTFIGAGAAVPVAAGDVMQSSAVIAVDDGAGGAPACFSVHLRARIYYDDASNEFCGIGESIYPGSTDYPNYPAPVVLSAIAPRRAIKATLASANITTSTHLAVYISGHDLTPVRVRVKRATWRKVA